MKRFFSSLKVFFFILILVIIIAGVFIAIRMVKAGPQWVTVYPASCLGGWENPSLAQGEPDLPDDAQFNDFNNDNSARLAHANAQIFCGGFPVQTIENTNIQAISLKLSWAVEGIRPVQPKIIEPKEEDKKENEAAIIEAVEPKTEPEVINPTPVEEAVPPAEEINVPETETENVDQPEQPAPEQPESTEGDVSTFNWNIFATPVYAEDEVEQSTDELKEIQKTDDIVVPTQEALFEVKYSTDGKEWTSLGTVTRVSLPDAVFSIPTSKLNSWESLKDLQVRIDRLTTLDDPVTYLDGMSLTVTYVPSVPVESLEVVAIPDTLHISNITVAEGVLPLHVERIDGKETLIITSEEQPIGDFVIFGGDNDSQIVLDTHIDSTEYKIPAESIGLGNFTVVATPDPDHCKQKDRLVCASEAGAISNSFIIEVYQVPTTTPQSNS